MAQNLLTISAGIVTEISTAYSPLASPTFTGTITSGGQIAVNDATDSTWTGSGSIVTAGGLGVAKAAYFGGAVNAKVLNTTDDVSQINNIGRHSAGFPWSAFTCSATSSGYKFRNPGGAAILTLDQSSLGGSFGGPVSCGVYAFASLPAGSAGMRAFVNNNSAGASFGSAANGSGSTTYPVYHDGTSWKVG